MAEKAQLLIVEDDLDLAEMLISYFKVQGYDVISAAWGEEAVRLGQERVPDLIVLDIRLPDIDGYEVCRRLRSSRRTASLPIIFLTEKRDRVDKLTGLELGVVDYITKPFDIQELRLRVRNALQRAGLVNQFNPVTDLPQAQMVDERLDDMLAENDWVTLVARIEGLDEFREDYGFKAADDVLRSVAQVIKDAVAPEAEASADFVGHLESGDLLVITTLDRASIIHERVMAQLDTVGADLYPLQDREKALQAMRERRLRVHIAQVAATDAIFHDLESVKERLLLLHQDR